MKNVIHLFVLFILLSCVSYRAADFNNRIFVSEPTHMMGKTEIQFYSDSLYILKERDGLFYSTGTWRLLENKILISSFKKETQDTEIPQPPMLLNFIEKELLIKNRERLVYDNSVLLRKN